MLEPEFIEAAKALIAADSVTERGNLRAVEVLEPLWREAGLETRRLPSPDSADRDANLLVGPGGGAPAEEPGLLLVTHLDTVDPGPRDTWRTDPFTFTIAGDRAHGLGVADVKLDALCKLWAARRLRGVRLARPFWFLGTYGEEAGLRGAKQFLADPPLRPFAALLGEPCGNLVYSAHKGYAMVRVRLEPSSPVALPAGRRSVSVFHGRSVHSSTPHLGVNAVDRALEVIADGTPVSRIHGGASTNAVPARCEVSAGRPLGDEVTEAEEVAAIDLGPLVPVARALRTAWLHGIAGLVPASDPRFDPSVAVGNLTRIRTIDGGLELWLDARLLPQHDPRALLDGFIAEANRIAGPVARATVHVERDAAGMHLPDDAPLVQRFGAVLRSLGMDGDPRAKATSTEAGVFVRAGIPAVVFGPTPSTNNAHTANEYALLEQVERAIDVYEALIRSLCT